VKTLFWLVTHVDRLVDTSVLEKLTLPVCRLSIGPTISFPFLVSDWLSPPPPSLRSSHPVGYKLLATKLETACKPLACTYESTRHHNPEEHPHLHFECSASCFHYAICFLDSWHFIWLTNGLSVWNASRMFSVFRRAYNWTPPWGTSFTSSQRSYLYNADYTFGIIFYMPVVSKRFWSRTPIAVKILTTNPSIRLYIYKCLNVIYVYIYIYGNTNKVTLYQR
jgi:hypothetical protein